ncbi:MAG TPA: Lpg1974 family pore-forming outer membrane protein [Candidatus Cybelea sp.]|nr:Lpg1974 family pore-forming outer membrane protein [Candidatus Cybelea sp.]
MNSTLRTKLLGGVAAVSLITLVGAQDASAQTAKPGSFSMFVQGGYDFGGSSTNDLVFAEGIRLDRNNTAGVIGASQPVGSGTGSHPFTVSPNHGLSGRVGGAYQINDRWSIRGSYTGLRASKRGNSGALKTQNGNAGVFTVLGNGTTDTGSVTSSFAATVKTRIRADVVDLQAGYDVGLGGTVNATVLGGIRFGEFNQNTDVTLLQSNLTTPQAFQHRSSTFFGVGPTLGAQVTAPIGGGFGVEGGVLGGLLRGHQTTKTDGQFANDGDPLQQQRFKDDHWAETANAEAALTFILPVGSGAVQIAAGYEAMWFLGVRDTRNGISVTNSTFGSHHDDLFFHGPFVRVGGTF